MDTISYVCLFIIFGIVLIIIGVIMTVSSRKRITSLTHKLKYTDPAIVLKIYQMLYDVDKILRQNNIPYWIEAGTLLGAVRHQGFIPWDDDADIDIDVKYSNNIYALKNKLNDLGYDIIKTWFGYKIFPMNGEIISNHTHKYPFLDILLVEIKNGEYHFASENAEKTFGQCLKIADIHPIRRYKFGTIELSGPNNPYPYLDKSYGNNWPDIAYKTYDHQNEKNINKVEIKLNNKDKKAAEPTGPINL